MRYLSFNELEWRIFINYLWYLVKNLEGLYFNSGVKLFLDRGRVILYFFI